MLKNEFLAQMRDLLGDRMDEYLKAIEMKPVRGFRVNTLKTDEAFIRKELDFEWVRNPYASNSWILPDEVKLYESPAYTAGLFYVQETSASSAVEILDPRPGSKVLDLCAAPGSKSTQIAERMEQKGFLVCNEYESSRAMILVENLEKHGAANTCIINSDTRDVAAAFPEYFDYVLCDAPCSGEGMFRKNPEACDEWSPENVLACARRQLMILNNAYQTLKPGGILVYSTCTLNETENENTVIDFLNEHPDMKIDPIPDIYPHTFKSRLLDGVLRILPSESGEGHFVCRMRKDGEGRNKELKQMKSDRIDSTVTQFLKEQLDETYSYLYSRNGRIYGADLPFVSISPCRLVRFGVLLGEVKGSRFEPDHGFYASAAHSFRKVYDLDDEQLVQYIHGDTLTVPLNKGWYGVAYKGHVFAGGKSDGRMLKNKYPKRLRRR